MLPICQTQLPAVTIDSLEPGHMRPPSSSPLDLSLDPGHLQTKGLGFLAQCVQGVHQDLQRFYKDYNIVGKVKISDHGFTQRYPTISHLHSLPHYPVDTSVKKGRGKDASLPHSRFYLEEARYISPLFIALSVQE